MSEDDVWIYPSSKKKKIPYNIWRQSCFVILNLLSESWIGIRLKIFFLLFVVFIANKLPSPTIRCLCFSFIHSLFLRLPIHPFTSNNTTRSFFALCFHSVVPAVPHCFAHQLLPFSSYLDSFCTYCFTSSDPDFTVLCVVLVRGFCFCAYHTHCPFASRKLVKTVENVIRNRKCLMRTSYGNRSVFFRWGLRSFGVLYALQ